VYGAVNALQSTPYRINQAVYRFQRDAWIAGLLFFGLYPEPVLQNFLDQQRKAHPGISLPDPPQTGDLDIQQVLASPYFFA
jgi:DNA-directed RNA polymerase